MFAEIASEEAIFDCRERSLKTELPCYGSEGEEEDLSSSPVEYCDY